MLLCSVYNTSDVSRRLKHREKTVDILFAFTGQPCPRIHSSDSTTLYKLLLQALPFHFNTYNRKKILGAHSVKNHLGLYFPKQAKIIIFS